MRQVPEDDLSIGTAISMGHSFRKDFGEKGSKCNLLDEQDSKSLHRQSAVYHVNDLDFVRLKICRNNLSTKRTYAYMKKFF